MVYLIDGHNVIGQLPDIDLADPDDEVKLILKLRSFAGRVGKKLTVVFDSGLPAGYEKTLSTPSVQVHFAPNNSSADAVIINMIRKASNPAGWILVTSDTMVADTGRQRKMQVITAQQFAQTLNAPPTKKKSHQAIPTTKAEPRLSKAEVEEWLRLFGEDSD